ncbi:hypothetical protein D3C85_1698870 [compost metagenome]
MAMPCLLARLQASSGTMKDSGAGAAPGSVSLCNAAVVHTNGDNSVCGSSAKLQPTMPWAPLPKPDVTEARLVAVVAGKPTRKCASFCINEARNGACLA